MNSILIQTLLQDHENIRNLEAQIRGLIASALSANESRCLELFRRLRALVTAHSKAEEYTLYALYDLDQKPDDEWLQAQALEGYEEHDLIDKILKEMDHAKEIGPQWKAQFKIVGELIERHFLDEQAEFFPQVQKRLNEVDSREMHLVYVRERDQIFSKKCGLDIYRSEVLTSPARPSRGPDAELTH